MDEIWDLIESVSEGFPTYSYTQPILSLRFLSKIQLMKKQISIKKTLVFVKNLHVLTTYLFSSVICSNSNSNCKVDQKKTVAFSQMFNHVQGPYIIPQNN